MSEKDTNKIELTINIEGKEIAKIKVDKEALDNFLYKETAASLNKRLVINGGAVI